MSDPHQDAPVAEFLCFASLIGRDLHGTVHRADGDMQVGAWAGELPTEVDGPHADSRSHTYERLVGTLSASMAEHGIGQIEIVNFAMFPNRLVPGLTYFIQGNYFADRNERFSLSDLVTGEDEVTAQDLYRRLRDRALRRATSVNVTGFYIGPDSYLLHGA